MKAKHTYVYGPVPSRRLGRSLGVDLVPHKTCNLNCIYCQLGPTARTTMERADYSPVDAVVEDVRARLAEGVDVDYVTLGGSGEPTLHRHFGEIATGIKASGAVPTALLTNGMLFYLPEVRAACADIDLVLPSLDAGDEETFRRINRPHEGLTLEMLVDGLARLRREHAGRMWLEVFIVDGVNSSDEQVLAIKRCVQRIEPHRVQLNIAVRPPAEQDVRMPSAQRLEEICEMLGPTAEIIAPVRDFAPLPGAAAKKAEVLAMLRRRPCTLEDIAGGLGIHPNEALKCLRPLLDAGTVAVRQRLYQTYYEAASGSA
jgi:wyosine [tRNA(Phe)-imidazoG37] synthetase (radical SAM superfamily)